MEWRCDSCGFELYNPIIELTSTVVGLYDDARFPGRCIVAHKYHIEDLDSLDEGLDPRFLPDAQMVGRALKRVVSATRINYAILGNAVPHLHWHVIPRNGLDPVPNKAPWAHPDPVLRLYDQQREHLIRALRSALSRQLLKFQP